MNDIEMRRSILQFACDHKYDHHLRFVYTEDMPFLKEIDAMRRVQILQILRNNGLIKNENSTWTSLSITTRGIFLVEHQRELDEMFPVHYELPERTRTLVDTVEELLSGKYDVPLKTFTKAKTLLYDTQSPDYLNSIKEAVVATESLAKTILNKPNATLGELIPDLKKGHLAHPAMAKIIEAVYVIRGDEPNVAHGGIEESGFGYPEAEFFLNTCGALIIYLARRAEHLEGR